MLIRHKPVDRSPRDQPIARLLIIVALLTLLGGCGRIGFALLPASEPADRADAGATVAPEGGRDNAWPNECAALEGDRSRDTTCEPAADCNPSEVDGSPANGQEACATYTGAPPAKDPCEPSGAVDTDSDGVCDQADRCPGHPDDADADRDGVPDGCDLPSCGDGRLQPELGETCDPSSAGGACPSECDDENPCTTDEKQGSPNACNVTCSHRQVMTAQDDDGCCPQGGDATSDSDCRPVCGNHVVEPGETCDGGPQCIGCQAAKPSSLVHRYDFEGTGTAALDRVGTAHGRCIRTSVQHGSVDLARNVVGNYVELPPGILSELSQVTLEVWLEWDGGDGGQHIFDFGNHSGGHGTSFFALDPRSATGRLTATLNLTSTPNDVFANWSVADHAPLDQLRIHYLAVTFDGSTLSLYLDGDLRDSSTRAGGSLALIDDQNNWLGRSQEAGSTELDAILYEFRIHDRALTAAEIDESYRAGADL